MSQLLHNRQITQYDYKIHFQTHLGQQGKAHFFLILQSPKPV